MAQTIGDRLKIARKRANIYQEDAAKAMGMVRPTLSAIESNKRAVSAEEVKDFAEIYHISVLELLYGFKDEPEDETFTSQKQRLQTYVSGYAKLKPEYQNQVMDLIHKLEKEQ